jgi:alkylhydroperoxidase family enzyme
MTTASNDGPFLAPKERPQSWVKRLLFFFARRQFGKVPSSFSVFVSRMPLAFGMFYGKVDPLDKKLTLPRETAILVRGQVTRINLCTCCMDLESWYLDERGLDRRKYDALEHYQTDPLFSEAERAALDYVSELVGERKVRPETFERLSRHFSERGVCEIVWLVASEHLYNMTNLGLNIHSDGLCDLRRARSRARGK